MELQRHPKSIRDPHKLSETLDCLQESKSNVGQHIKLNLGVEGEDVHSSPPKLSRPPEPSPSGLDQGETSRLGHYLLIDSQGLPYTVLVEEVWGQQGVYSCPVCLRTFEYLSYLQRHSITHSESKPHICRACGKAFKRTSHLERHKYTHSGRKPHQCPICQRRFRDSGELSHHQRVHTGERPYQCEACHMRFGERNTLQRHIRRKHLHTGERPFGCSVCGKRFTQSSALTTHRRLHTGEKPFECAVCCRRFNNSSNFAKHRRIHGPDSVGYKNKAVEKELWKV
uniref:Zinc finger protein 581 n=1 Tax=Naja naja TaxID=35670 RepID=A0A8C7DVA5_NAJNA